MNRLVSLLSTLILVSAQNTTSTTTKQTSSSFETITPATPSGSASAVTSGGINTDYQQQFLGLAILGISAANPSDPTALHILEVVKCLGVEPVSRCQDSLLKECQDDACVCGKVSDLYNQCYPEDALKKCGEDVLAKKASVKKQLEQKCPNTAIASGDAKKSEAGRIAAISLTTVAFIMTMM